MKSIIAATIVTVAMLFGIPLPFQGNQELVEMQLSVDEIFENKVKVFDFDGNLLKEMTVEDVAHDDISVSDYFILESSGFAFKYMGDYYYMRD